MFIKRPCMPRYQLKPNKNYYVKIQCNKNNFFHNRINKNNSIIIISHLVIITIFMKIACDNYQNIGGIALILWLKCTSDFVTVQFTLNDKMSVMRPVSAKHANKLDKINTNVFGSKKNAYILKSVNSLPRRWII